jgi:hypothetical protein
MEIDQQVNGIVQNVVAGITNQIQAQALDAINQQIAQVVNNIDYNSIVSEKLNQMLNAKVSQLPINATSIESELSSRVSELAQNLYTTVQNKSIEITTNAINSYVSKIDFGQLCQSAVISALQNVTLNFPDNSIPSTAIQKDTMVLSGNNIYGGIIKNFGSTGIDDKATDCQVTIMDDITVVENNLLTKDLTVKGTATIEGDLNVTGSVDPTSAFYINLLQETSERVMSGLNQELFNKFSKTVFDNISANGIDLNKITMNGTAVIDSKSLANTVTSSNLQKVGTLKELQVSGETFLSGTLYSTTQRVGINTIEPANALSVWDQEIEIGAGKLSNSTGFIGTPRNQTLVLSSNNKNNLTLNTDGSVSVNTIQVGQTTISSAITPPSDDQLKGTIVFNANPSIGGPMGWVSLGNSRWANFGIID